MALPKLRIHQIQGNKVEAIQYMEYATGQTFLSYEIVKMEAGNTGKIVVSGADPASGTIVGITLQAADSSPGFQMANNPATFTYRSQKVSVCRPNDETIFAGCLTNGSSTPVAAAVTDIGQQYGVTAYSGIWTIDKAKTGGSARVTIVGYDTDQNPDQVFFKFISSFLA